MSYAVPSQPPPPGTPAERPMVVTVSTWLLWATAALYAISAAIGLAYSGTTADVLEQAYAGTSAEGQEGVGAIGLIVGAVLSLAFAVGFVLLGIFNNQGKNPSRITTWVIGGIALCCGGIGLILNSVLGGVEVEGGPDPDEIERLLSDALPGWYDAVTWITSIGGILALLTALILLALPAANEFFRKPTEEIFEPPPSYPPPMQ